MKAPDKVYVKKEKNNVVYSLSVQYDNGGEEYIRKDALLEWVKEMKRICRGAEPIEKAYQTIIDKLNSM